MARHAGRTAIRQGPAVIRSGAKRTSQIAKGVSRVGLAGGALAARTGIKTAAAGGRIGSAVVGSALRTAAAGALTAAKVATAGPGAQVKIDRTFLAARHAVQPSQSAMACSKQKASHLQNHSQQTQALNKALASTSDPKKKAAIRDRIRRQSEIGMKIRSMSCPGRYSHVAKSAYNFLDGGNHT